MSLFMHFFKVLCLYLEARIRIRIKLKVRIRIRIKAIGWIRISINEIRWIRIRINLQMTSKNVWNMSPFEHFFKVLSLYWKLGSLSGSAS
jgi:hypothetical protein